MSLFTNIADFLNAIYIANLPVDYLILCWIIVFFKFEIVLYFNPFCSLYDFKLTVTSMHI